MAALPDSEWQRLFLHIEPKPASVQLGHVVYEAGARLDSVHFPTTPVASLLHVPADGASAEFAVVGNDGLAGVALFVGGETTPSRAVLQGLRWAYRLKGHQLKE